MRGVRGSPQKEVCFVCGERRNLERERIKGSLEAEMAGKPRYTILVDQSLAVAQVEALAGRVPGFLAVRRASRGVTPEGLRALRPRPSRALRGRSSHPRHLGLPLEHGSRHHAYLGLGGAHVRLGQPMGDDSGGVRRLGNTTGGASGEGESAPRPLESRSVGAGGPTSECKAMRGSLSAAPGSGRGAIQQRARRR